MKKQSIVTRPTKTSELTFDELYGQISDNWSFKAERLQARRWHKLRQEIKSELY